MNSCRSSRFRVWLLSGFLFALLATTRFVSAQPPPAVAAPAPSGAVQSATRPFYVEAAVVVLLMGGAVFVVCRSSRR
ncbi:MAG: hypothetical protein U0872_06375 [Planctomycetaceae bacterium]